MLQQHNHFDEHTCVTPNSSLLVQDGVLNQHISSILSVESPTTADEDLLNTQSLHILKGVVAFVEVRTGTENRSKAICRELQLMGATVVPKFTNEVTHVIFKDGKKSTCDKARKKNIYLVSVLWVDSCKQNQEHVCENLFPGWKPEEKGTPIMVARLKKSKSMQPKDFDEEVASSAEKNVKNRKRMATIAERALVGKLKYVDSDEDDETPTRRPMFLVEDTCPRSPAQESFITCTSIGRNITVPDTPPSMRRKLNNLKARKSLGQDFIPNSDSEEVSENEKLSSKGEDFNNTPVVSATDGMPLQRRLFNKNKADQSLLSSLEENPLSSIQGRLSSPLLLSAPSSSANNSPDSNVTSPYVQRLIQRRINQEISPVSKFLGPKVSLPLQKDTSASDVETNGNSPVFSKDKSHSKTKKKGVGVNNTSLSLEIENYKALRKSSCNTASRRRSSAVKKSLIVSTVAQNKTKDDHICDDSTLQTENPNGEKRQIKSIVGKKKLLRVIPDVKPSSQLIAPINNTKDKLNKDGEVNSTIKRKKVTAKKKLNNNESSRDPSVLFTGNKPVDEIKVKNNVGTNNRKRKNLSLGEDADDEMGETPMKKSRQSFRNIKLNHNTKYSINEATALGNSLAQNKQGYTDVEAMCEPSVEITRSASITTYPQGNTSKRKRKSVIEKEMYIGNKRKSSLKISRLNESESGDSQPYVAPDVNTPPEIVCFGAQELTDKDTNDISATDKINSKKNTSRKSVHFKAATLQQESESVNCDSYTKKKNTRRRSAIETYISLDLQSNNKTEVILGKDERLNSHAKISESSLPDSGIKKKKSELSNIENVAPNRRVSRRSSISLASNQSNSMCPKVKKDDKEYNEIDANKIDIQKIKKSVINKPLEAVKRRKSVRLSIVNHNDSVISTQGLSGSLTSFNNDSITDVSALSTQDMSLSPSYRTKKLFSDLRKKPANLTEDTLDRSNLVSENLNFVADSVFEPSEDENEEGIEVPRESEKERTALSCIAHEESIVMEKSTNSILHNNTTVVNKSTLFNLTRSRRSVEEFVTNKSNGSVKKGKSLAGSDVKCKVTCSEKVTNKTQSTSQKSKSCSSITKVKNEGKVGKKVLKSESHSHDKRKWKNLKIESKNNAKSGKNIVTTSLHFDEQDMVSSVVQRLGIYHIEENVNKNTTHVVSGSDRRTLNVLYGIVRGVWVVSIRWVFESLEAGRWLNEKDYEISDTFPACQISRVSLEAKGELYCCNLFNCDGKIYVSDSTLPPKKHLKYLIELCGAKVTSSIIQADLCIGATQKSDVLSVSEQWVLDSITQMKCLPFTPYKLNSPIVVERAPSPDY